MPSVRGLKVEDDDADAILQEGCVSRVMNVRFYDSGIHSQFTMFQSFLSISNSWIWLLVSKDKIFD